MGLFSFLDAPRKPRRHRVLLTVAQTRKYARLSTVRRKIRLAAAKRAEQLGRAVYIEGRAIDGITKRPYVYGLDVIHFDSLRRYGAASPRWGA